jgi:hypothetical protein
MKLSDLIVENVEAFKDGAQVKVGHEILDKLVADQIMLKLAAVNGMSVLARYGEDPLVSMLSGSCMIAAYADLAKIAGTGFADKLREVWAPHLPVDEYGNGIGDKHEPTDDVRRAKALNKSGGRLLSAEEAAAQEKEKGFGNPLKDAMDKAVAEAAVKSKAHNEAGTKPLTEDSTPETTPMNDDTPPETEDSGEYLPKNKDDLWEIEDEHGRKTGRFFCPVAQKGPNNKGYKKKQFFKFKSEFGIGEKFDGVWLTVDGSKEFVDEINAERQKQKDADKAMARVKAEEKELQDLRAEMEKIEAKALEEDDKIMKERKAAEDERDRDLAALSKSGLSADILQTSKQVIESKFNTKAKELDKAYNKSSMPRYIQVAERVEYLEKKFGQTFPVNVTKANNTSGAKPNPLPKKGPKFAEVPSSKKGLVSKVFA